MFPGSTIRRPIHSLLAVLAALVSAPAALSAAAVIVEGFETPGTVRAVRGPEGTRVKLAGIKGAPYVTQGDQAALVPPGTTVSVAVSAKALGASKWLRIDTVALQSLPHRVYLSFLGTDLSVVMPAYVQPGSDTLAVPLSVVQAKASAPWPEAGVVLSVRNSSGSALVIDNIRLEPAAAPPPGALLLDYGPRRQVVWPGFVRGGGKNDPIKWGKVDDSHPADQAGWPDPLGCDFVGPRLGIKAIDSITLGTGAKSISAWLWLTHYSIGKRQPAQYVVMFGRGPLMRGQLSPREMLGPKGLLEGASGPWTPQWFAEEYSSQFLKMVPVTAGGTRRQVDLGNCQLAAAAMVPLGGRKAMAEYVKQIQSDLQRYRRQFVVGATHRVKCSIAPMAVEQRTGAMVFSAPGGRSLTSNWVPRSADRASTIDVKAAAGMDVVVSLVVVPLRAAKSFSISVPLLRSTTGRILAFEKPGLVPYCVQRVSRVASARASFQPWVLVHPTKFRAEVGDVCTILLKGRIRNTVPAGKYTGRLTVTRSGLRTEIPLEMTLLDMTVAPASDPIIGVSNSVMADDFYGPLSAALSPARQVLETGKIRRQLLTGGIDALTMPAVTVSGGGDVAYSVTSSNYAAALKGFPTDVATRGRTVLNASRTGANFEMGLGRLLSLASAARLKNRYLLWYSRGEIAGADKAAGVALGTADKGSAMMALNASALLAVQDVTALAPWSALAVIPDAKDLGKGIAGALKGGVKKVYLYSMFPDRYVSGFYSCAVGAAGSYVVGASSRGGAYSGCWIDGRGMLAVQSSGDLTPTVALVRIWQARSDYQLMQSCRALLARHKKAPGADELAAVLKKIADTAAAHEPPSFSSAILRTTAVSPATMDTWRAELFAAAAKMLGR